MNCVCCIGLSPNGSKIFYEVKDRTEIQAFVSELKLKRNETPRAIIYCRSFKMCSDLYAYFHLQLGQQSYFPDSGKPVSENRLFAMFHSLAQQRIKNIVLDGLAIPNGTVRIVLATMALGMGVNLKRVNRIIHYGSLSSLDNYFKNAVGVEERERKQRLLFIGKRLIALWTVILRNCDKRKYATFANTSKTKQYHLP